MNYPYPIPGSGSSPVQSPENYFHVGNICCNGSVHKDDEATVRVFFDYSQAMANVIGGNTITNVVLTVTTIGDEVITIPSQSFVNNVKSFLVVGGQVGGQYGIEAVAELTDGQVWVDNITVVVTDCTSALSISGGTLLSTFGPLVISNTLYYTAMAGQTIFILSTPDKFGHVGVLADSNVLVYEAGGRQVPYDNYNVSVRANIITFVNPLTEGEIVVFDLITPQPPPPIYPPPVLITGGMIATSLYYFALSGQTVFSLSTPDRFNHVGNIATATGNALVYVNGSRKEPVDDYTISLGANTIMFTSPITAGAEVDFDLVTPPPPAPVIPPPILLNAGVIGTTLYYRGLNGQTVFSLGVPDEFNNIGEMTDDGVQVYRSGNRLTFTDDYTINITGNSVTLTYPTGDDEPIIIELISPPPTPVLVDIALKTEALNIITLNIIPNLTYTPNGVMTILYVNGLAFFSVGAQASFTVSGNTLTWTSTMFSIPVGAAVVAVYTYG
jgi:hypothetical protein